MREEVKRKIADIMGEMHCPKNFICAESGFNELCRMIDIGLESYLVCLDPDPTQCKFALSYDHKYYCRCPLRVYISKVLEK